MQVILLHDVEKLGRRGESVDVSNGHARNFLFPKGLAVRADPSRQRELEQRLKSLEIRDDRTRQGAEDLSAKLADASVKIVAAAGDEDRLYGSVNSTMIAEALVEKGFEIEAHQIGLSEPLKALGSYTVPVHLHRDVSAEVQVWIERS